MGKRDAFGNEIEENPLDAMGWKVGEPAPPASIGETTPPAVAAAPLVAATPAKVPPAPTMPTSAAPRLTPSLPTQLPNISTSAAFGGARVFARLISVIVFLAIAGGITAAVLSAVNTADKVKKTFSIPFNTPSTSNPSSSTPSTPSQPAKPSQPPVGLQKGSLVRADSFAPAIVRIRQQGSRATTMRVDPTRISANVLDNDDVLKIASVTWDGNVQTIKTSSRQTGATTVSLRAISSNAPSRALARSASLLGRPARSFNYMVLLNFAGKAQWIVYFKDGKYVRASADGRNVQRVN